MRSPTPRTVSSGSTKGADIPRGSMKRRPDPRQPGGDLVRICDRHVAPMVGRFQEGWAGATLQGYKAFRSN